MLSREDQNLKLDDSMNSFDVNAYRDVLLHHRVRSLILEHHRDKEKRAFRNDEVKKNLFVSSEIEEESKEAVDDYEYMKASFHDQFDFHEIKSVGNYKRIDFSNLSHSQPNTSQSDHGAYRERAQISSRSQNVVVQDNSMNTTSVYRDRLDQWFEMRKVLPSIYNHIGEKVMTHAKFQNERSEIRQTPKRNTSSARYRIHSSRCFLAKHYEDPFESPEKRIAPKAAAFDPFSSESSVSAIDNANSCDDADWPCSDFAFDVMDSDKSPNDSNFVSSRNAATISTTNVGNSPIKRTESDEKPPPAAFKSKENSGESEITEATKKKYRPSLICAKNKPKSIKKSGAKNSSSVCDQTGQTSSCDTSATPTDDDIRFHSKSPNGFESDDIASRNCMTSFSKPKSAKKEWLRTSIGPENGSQRKRDQKMQEWFSDRGVSYAGGDDDWSTRGAVMEMVFHD